VFLDAAFYPDVNFYSPNDGREGSSSCYAISHSVTGCEFKYDVSFDVSA
jgi:hypothetical protein